MQQTQRGFFFPLLVLVVALLAVGGGIYYSSQRQLALPPAPVTSNESAVGVDSFTTAPATSTATSTPSATSSVVAAPAGTGNLRSLFALNQNLKCTYTSTVGAASSGTVYLAGDMLRGDFSLKGAAVSEAHLLRRGDDVYVWTGNQGAKMPVSNILKESTGTNQTGVDLNQQVKYSCESWAKDDARFALPATVNFLDLAALMPSVPVGANLSR